MRAEIRVIKDKINSKIAELRSRPSSSTPPAPPTPQQLSTPPPTVTQQQPNSPIKKKRNKRTRQQYKRKKALHVTIQLSVKEVEHTVRVKHQKKPGKHVMLLRTKQIP